MTRARRSAGLLLHPSSLPGGHGIGDLGGAARALLDWMVGAGLSVWQVLPLGPVDAGGSPYTAPSALGGNLALVDLAELYRHGLLDGAALRGPPASDRAVDHGKALAFKVPRVLAAASKLLATPAHPLRPALDAYLAAEADWLDDVAAFFALRERFAGEAWTAWPAAARDRDPALLTALRDDAAYATQRAAQFLFDHQWSALRAAAAERGIRIVGDAPIYVAHDSADVWAHRGLFDLDDDGLPNAVAGVPPDAFAAEGQLWGNPLYRWSAHAADGFAWWRRRLARLGARFDQVRIDHFRGLAAYWRVPFGSTDARDGAWVAGPGSALLDALRSTGVAILAEDLGIIDDAVVALRDSHDLPGMGVLQFAWNGDPDNVHLPYNLRRNTVVYTGTHDNDTSLGWWRSAPEVVRHRFRVYQGVDGHDAVWDLIRMALATVADVAIVPAQDVLALGGEARMNTPGENGGNWAFRLRPGELAPHHAARLRLLLEAYGRLPEQA